MTYTTLANWKAQVTAKGIEPNVAMRLLQDAQEQIDALKAQNAVDSEAAQSLTCVIADIAAAVGIRDGAPNLCRETVKAVNRLVEDRNDSMTRGDKIAVGYVKLMAERDALRAALRDLLGAIHEASDMAQVEHLLCYIEEAEDNARRVLGEVKG